METNPKKILELFRELKISNLMRMIKHSPDTSNSLSPYHMEEDVFTHTMMVFKEAMKYEDPYLLYAALFHDYGKCFRSSELFSTKHNTKIKEFKFHEIYSVYHSVNLLKKLGLNKQEIEIVLFLVAHHGILFQSRSVESFPKITEFERLKNFIKSDLDGRITSNDENKQFNEILESDIFKESEKDIPSEKICIVLQGLPGCGKTTLSEKICKDLNAFHLSKDIILMENYSENGSLSYMESYKKQDRDFVLSEENRILTEILKSGRNIVIDNTNVRFPYTNLIKSFGYYIHSMLVVCDFNTLIERNKNRSGKNIGIDVIEKLMREFFLIQNSDNLSLILTE